MESHHACIDDTDRGSPIMYNPFNVAVCKTITTVTDNIVTALVLCNITILCYCIIVIKSQQV